MHTETAYLKLIAEEIAAKPKNDIDNSVPDKHLAAEAERAKKKYYGPLTAY